VLTLISAILAQAEETVHESSDQENLYPHAAELIVGAVAFAIIFFFMWKWVLPRVNAMLGRGEAALYHAERCLELEVHLWHGLGEDPALCCSVGLRGGPLAGRAQAIPGGLQRVLAADHIRRLPMNDRAIEPGRQRPARASDIDRALGSTESIYYLLDKLYCLNFVVYARIEGRFDSGRLARALRHKIGEQPGADPDLVGPTGQVDRDHCHCASSLRISPMVRLCGPWRLVMWILACE